MNEVSAAAKKTITYKPHERMAALRSLSIPEQCAVFFGAVSLCAANHFEQAENNRDC